MKLPAVPLLALGVAGLFLASAVGAVVVSNNEDDEVTTDSFTTSSFPPFEEETTTSSLVTDPNATIVTEVPAPPVSLAPVQAPESASTTSSAPPAAAAPVLAVDPAPCQPPGSQPAPGSPVGASGVFTVAIGDGAVRATNPIGRLPAWRPRAGQVVSVSVASGRPPGLCLSGPDGAGAKAITTPVGVGRPALSFDGARVAVRSGRAGTADLVVFSVEAADQRLLMQGVDIGDPVWLGNGSGVVLCAAISGGRRLVTVPAGGGDPRVLRDGCPPGLVSSSPDGTRIAFSQGNQVSVMNVATRATTNLRIGTGVSQAAPSWAPDNRAVAFAFSDAQGTALGILDLQAGSGSVRHRAAGLTAPSWAPAGDQIAYIGTDGAGQGLFVVKPDGSGARRVVGCQARCTLAAQPWAPDASSAVVESTGAAA